MLSAHRGQSSLKQYFQTIEDRCDVYTSEAIVERPASSVTRPSLNRRVSSSSVPMMPQSVQTSLLDVGMRVRKAVGEGYKTQKLEPARPLFGIAEDDEDIRHQEFHCMSFAPMRRSSALSPLSPGSRMALASLSANTRTPTKDTEPMFRFASKKRDLEDTLETENGQSMPSHRFNAQWQPSCTSSPLSNVQPFSQLHGRRIAPLPQRRRKPVTMQMELDFEDAPFLTPKMELDSDTMLISP